jgi:hypothetical protein
MNRKILRPARIVAASVLAVVLLSAAPAAPRPLTDADWSKLKAGELVKDVQKEGGTQSGAWSAGLYNHPPALMWKVICSLESYPKYMARNTVSKLIDEGAKDRLVAAGDKTADEVEKLFAGMKEGFVKKEADGKWTVYSYQRNSFPWPVNDKWILLEITHDDKTMTQTWHRLAGNIKEDHGSWQLQPVPNDPTKTLAINDIHIDLDIPATGPFTAFAMDTTLPDTYKAFEKMAADMAGKK